MKKVTLLLMLGLMVALISGLHVAPLSASEVETSIGACDRSQIGLTGEWLFQADREDAGVKAAFFAADFDVGCAAADPAQPLVLNRGAHGV